MSKKFTLIVLLLITVLSLGLSVWAAPGLPQRVPSHWNAAGQIDGYAPRAQALWLMPLLGLGIGIFLLFLPVIDPLRKNIEQFRGAYNWIVIALAAFLAYLHALTLLAGLGASFNMTFTLLPALALMMIGLGFVIERTKPNWIAGIRTPWTLSSPTVWEKTHRLGGLTFKLAGLASLLGLLMPMEAGLWFALLPLALGALIPVGYSYWLYQQEQKK